MIKDRKNVCFCAFRCPLRRLESLAGPGISGDLPYGDGLAPCPQPSGKPWHHVPRAPSARPPDLVPALTLSLLPPAPAPCSGHRRTSLHGNSLGSIGPPGAQGSRGGKGVHAQSALLRDPERSQLQSVAGPAANEEWLGLVFR